MKKFNATLDRLKEDRTWFTISNILTFSRIALAPILVVGIAKHWWKFSFYLFLFASLSDMLDGFVARFFNQQTELGTLLDPIADKFFLVCSLGALSFIDSPSFQIPAWFFFMVVGRETIILIGSLSLMRLREGFEIHPTLWGKLTTFFQLLFICWLFICYFLKWAPVRTYGVFLVLLALFSLMSLLQYIKIGLSYLSNGVLGK